MNQQHHRSDVRYLMTWKDHPLHDATWEPLWHQEIWKHGQNFWKITCMNSEANPFWWGTSWCTHFRFVPSSIHMLSHGNAKWDCPYKLCISLHARSCILHHVFKPWTHPLLRATSFKSSRSKVECVLGSIWLHFALCNRCKQCWSRCPLLPFRPLPSLSFCSMAKTIGVLSCNT